MATKTLSRRENPHSPGRIPPDDYIDIEGAAKLIFVKRKTIDNWLSAGKLRRYKAGGRRTLVRKSEVLALVHEV